MGVVRMKPQNESAQGHRSRPVSQAVCRNPLPSPAADPQRLRGPVTTDDAIAITAQRACRWKGRSGRIAQRFEVRLTTQQGGRKAGVETPEHRAARAACHPSQGIGQCRGIPVAGQVKVKGTPAWKTEQGDHGMVVHRMGEGAPRLCHPRHAARVPAGGHRSPGHLHAGKGAAPRRARHLSADPAAGGLRSRQRLGGPGARLGRKAQWTSTPRTAMELGPAREPRHRPAGLEGRHSP
jgi:hypothetical protein